MVLQGLDMVTILLVVVQGLQDHQAAQIITLLHQEDIHLPHTLLVVHQAQEAQDGRLNSRALWGLLVVHQMDLRHHLHQVLMKCTTIDLVGLNQVMEVLALHIQVKTHQIMVLLQEHLLGHLQALLQEVLLQCRALIQAQHLGDHRHKANLLILANHHTQINSR